MLTSEQQNVHPGFHCCLLASIYRDLFPDSVRSLPPGSFSKLSELQPIGFANSVQSLVMYSNPMQRLLKPSSEIFRPYSLWLRDTQILFRITQTLFTDTQTLFRDIQPYSQLLRDTQTLLRGNQSLFIDTWPLFRGTQQRPIWDIQTLFKDTHTLFRYPNPIDIYSYRGKKMMVH